MSEWCNQLTAIRLCCTWSRQNFPFPSPFSLLFSPFPLLPFPLLSIILYLPCKVPLKLHSRLANAPPNDWEKGEKSPRRFQQPCFGPSLAAAKPPCWKMVMMWLCGLSSGPTPALSQEEKAALEQRLTSIEEEPLWRNVCNANAIILMTINVFLWAYFG